MTRARKELVSIDAAAYYHCICRCVRRAFLWGKDDYSGRNYEHRRQWVIERLRELGELFAVDLCAYAVMSNHYHLVLRMDPNRAKAWSEQEVMERWRRLYSWPPLVAGYAAGQSVTEAEKDAARAIIEVWRERLANLSWYMKNLNEHLARRANAEDDCRGRFWEGRFKSQALLDEVAVLSCMSYVDLNPVRAGVAETPETSDSTSIQQRIRQSLHVDSEPEPGEGPRLVDLDQKNVSDSHPQRFSYSTHDYLQLVDWAGRAYDQTSEGPFPPNFRRSSLGCVSTLTTTWST